MERIKAGQPTTHRDQLPSSSRYELLVRVASGGMATVYVGRLSGAVGFWRLVAVKRAHAHLLEDASFARMLVAEARLASRIHHPNVVAVQDVEELDGELLLVMDYVEGASLSALGAAAEESGEPLPARVAVRVVLDACAGLHAAHELADEDGRPLHLVHRDVSPHNVLVGIDGVSRLADFGIAKVSHGGSAGGTATGALKGKVAYMAPEYVDRGVIDPRGDVFALGVVAWESLTRRRLFRGSTDIETLRLVLNSEIEAPSRIAPWLGNALDEVLLKALSRAPEARYASAQAFGDALEAAARREDLIASPAEVARLVRALVGPALEQRRALIRDRMPTSDRTNEVSGVKARGRNPDEETPALPLVPEGGPTVTLPLATESAPGAEPESTTLGSGVSSRNVAEARRVDPVKRSRSPRVAVGIAIVVAAGALGVGAFTMRRHAPAPAASVAPAVSVTDTATATANANANANANATATATATATTTATAKPSASARPPPRPWTPPPSPPSKPEKAPPNPYGH